MCHFIREANKRRKVLVVGSTGYLDKYVVQEFKKQGYWVREKALWGQVLKYHTSDAILLHGETLENRVLLCSKKSKEILFMSLLYLIIKFMKETIRTAYLAVLEAIAINEYILKRRIGK
jgi:hypothetical protein